MPLRSAPWHAAQAFSYTFLPSTIAVPFMRIDLTMSFTATEASSSGRARNSPYSSSSGGGAAGCGRATFTVAPIPNANTATDMRRHVRPPDCEVNERQATSRALSSICVFLITSSRHGRDNGPSFATTPFTRFNSTYKAVELGQAIIYGERPLTKINVRNCNHKP
jgi:hypothetical protein